MKKNNSFTPNWEHFEIECTNFLNTKFNSLGFNFIQKGSTNSTETDIIITKNGIELDSIEVKMPNSQAGQIVVLIENNKFVFSKASIAPNNIYNQIIINYINDNFDKYNNVSTSPIKIDLDENILYSRIIEHYKNVKKSAFFITGDITTGHKALFKCEDLKNYFKISAVLRRKKSGTTDLPKKYRSSCIHEIKRHLLDKGIYIKNIFEQNNKFYVTLSEKLVKTQFQYIPCKNFYIFLAHDYNFTYRVKKKSNTNNPNIMFNLSLKLTLKEDIGLNDFTNYLNSL